MLDKPPFRIGLRPHWDKARVKLALNSALFWSVAHAESVVGCRENAIARRRKASKAARLAWRINRRSR